MSLPSPILVEDAAALLAACEDARGVSVISVDTESNSMHAYKERVCLVQLSFSGRDYIIDPLAVDISPLGDLFADERSEKILHAAEYDVICLRRDYGFSFENLFDTMIAARILGWKQFGLGSILASEYGVKLDKKMQRHDWGRRPLSSAAMSYARFDTHYLEGLRERQLEQLAESECETEARAAFARVALSEGRERVFDPEGFWRIKGVRDLDGQGLAILRALFGWRERLARELDRPLFKVVSDAVLVDVARQKPQSRAGLRVIRGMPPRLLQRNGATMLDVIKTGSEAETPVRPKPAARMSKAVERRFQKLREWRKKIAEGRGVEYDVILSRRVLEVLAEQPPPDLDQLRELDVLDAWQMEHYGARLVGLFES